MHISARVEYASSPLHVGPCGGRATDRRGAGPVAGPPRSFPPRILNDLRRVGIVTSQRGNEGGISSLGPRRRSRSARSSAGSKASCRGARDATAVGELRSRREHLQKVWYAVACVPATSSTRSPSSRSCPGVPRPGRTARGPPQRLGAPLAARRTGAEPRLMSRQARVSSSRDAASVARRPARGRRG